MIAEPPVKPVNAVVRAIAILRLLGASDRPLSVTEIAGELDLVASTAMHILKTLVHEGLVEQPAGTKRYRLGAGTAALARAYLERPHLAEHFQPHLDELAQKHGVTALGIEWDGGDTLNVTAIARATADYSVHANLGSRFPALTSATGRCFAAFGDWPQERLTQAFATLEWETPPDYTAWWAEVSAARENGFAVDEGNYIAGVTIIAVPVFDAGGTLLGALTTLALSGRLSGDGRDALIGDLKTAGKSISEAC